MIAHEMAHQEYYRHCDNLPYTNLENILFEGHAMNLAEQITNEMNLDWEPHYRSNTAPDINPNAVIEVLGDAGTIFQKGGEICQDAEGYQLAYLTVKNMLENTALALEQMPEEKPQDLKEIVEQNLRKTLN